MKNVFALLASLVLLAPAVLASPVAFPGSKGDGHCIQIRAQCGGKHGNCGAGYECKYDHDGGHGDTGVCICLSIGLGLGKGHGHD
ncbi:hypothetical protein B0J17DRAFT_719179 [Rhizoctonia solani]|nr:hypothetical protein B0J17DRAFT_719179 [Rhizoctonia solani]